MQEIRCTTCDNWLLSPHWVKCVRGGGRSVEIMLGIKEAPKMQRIKAGIWLLIRHGNGLFKELGWSKQLAGDCSVLNTPSPTVAQVSGRFTGFIMNWC